MTHSETLFGLSVRNYEKKVYQTRKGDESGVTICVMVDLGTKAGTRRIARYMKSAQTQ